jgi:hypothetical protein
MPESRTSSEPGGATAPKGIVREYRPGDREAVRRICRETGLKGDPTWRFFEDHEVLTALYADYYLDHESDACFVAEVDGRVVGYQLTCPDTRRRNRILATRVLPRLALRVVFRLLTGRYRNPETYRALWWMASRSWRERMKVPLDEFPAHGHFNMDAAHRGAGLGNRLNRISKAHDDEHDVRGMHIIIREPQGEERLSRYFVETRHYQVIQTRRFTLVGPAHRQEVVCEAVGAGRGGARAGRPVRRLNRVRPENGRAPPGRPLPVGRD